MDQMSRQIANLDKRDDDGESDTDLCDQAMDIYDIIKKRKAEAKGNTYQEAAVHNEETAFIRVLQKIKGHRHEHALDQLKTYVGSIDWVWYERVFIAVCDATNGPCACGGWHKSAKP